MIEISELSDLRPAPRSTPKPVLWLMAAVVSGGALLLGLRADPGPAAPGSTVSVQKAAPVVAWMAKAGHAHARTAR